MLAVECEFFSLGTAERDQTVRPSDHLFATARRLEAQAERDKAAKTKGGERMKVGDRVRLTKDALAEYENFSNVKYPMVIVSIDGETVTADIARRHYYLPISHLEPVDDFDRELDKAADEIPLPKVEIPKDEVPG